MEKLTVILIHGWGGSKESLAGISEVLNDQDITNIRLEYPGHGKTKAMDKPWHMNNFIKWLKTEVNRLGLSEDQIVLAGHSFGGKIIIGSLVKGDLKPHKAILIDANGVKPKNSFKKSFWKFFSLLFRVIKKIPGAEKIRYFFYRYIIRETDYINTTNNKNLSETFKNIVEMHYDDMLNKIKVPTLIIWGKKDKQTPLWMGEKMNEEIKDSKIIHMNDSHGLPIKRPMEVANEIIKFIKYD